MNIITLSCSRLLLGAGRQKNPSSACTRLSHSPIWPYTELGPCLRRSSMIPADF